MKNEKPSLLEFNRLTVIKGGRKVLDSLSLKIYEGDNMAILGPNGAGKSSLIKVITKEYYPIHADNSCSFRIWGQDQWNVFELRKLLGIVSNDLQAACTRDTSGLDVVLSGFFSSIGLYKERLTPKMKKKAQEAIDFLEIRPLQHRNMNEMSSGEARRFLIARALVHAPKALILDEPTNNLDLHAMYKFTDMIRKITKSGTSVILVTQNLSDIIPEIKRVILMKGGKLYQDGAKDSVLTSGNISKLFDSPVEITTKKGYYYALRA